MSKEVVAAAEKSEKRSKRVKTSKASEIPGEAERPAEKKEKKAGKAKEKPKREDKKEKEGKNEKSEKDEEKKEKKKEDKEKSEREEESAISSRARPLCPPKIEKTVYNVISMASNNKLLKVGVNEVIKSLNKGAADIVIIAADTSPFPLVQPVLGLCEDKNRNYYFVPSKTSLGKACGFSRPVAACSILSSEQSSIKKLINEIRDQMQG